MDMLFENLTGKQLGIYQVQSVIGQGGMALVYKAYQPTMNRSVALKILPRDGTSDTTQAQRFKQEAQIIAKLEHPCILPIYDYGESGNYVYLVMRLIERGTLLDLMRGVPLPLGRIRDIVSQVGEALSHAHSYKVVHRDIKPQNILIDENGNCLLSDFGISKILNISSNFSHQGIVGTPDYMSPEQGQGLSVDHRSDIYSLGVVLYEMVTGRVPFHADTPIATIYQHIHNPPPSPLNFNPQLPETVVQVIGKALAKQPAERFATAKEMVIALREAISQGVEGSVFSPLLSPREEVPEIDYLLDASPQLIFPATEGATEAWDIPGQADTLAGDDDEGPDMLSIIEARAKMSYGDWFMWRRQQLRAEWAQEEIAVQKQREQMWAEEKQRQVDLIKRKQAEERNRQKQIDQLLIALSLLVLILRISLLVLVVIIRQMSP
jgi:serine/threonine protein kinase